MQTPLNGSDLSYDEISAYNAAKSLEDLPLPEHLMQQNEKNSSLLDEDAPILSEDVDKAIDSLLEEFAKRGANHSLSIDHNDYDMANVINESLELGTFL